ncbi:MAG: 16S rRNA (uracil(1498)-N(3))-methyltransferase [Bacteroidales bacterium]|nr:16S rRNA (uracil(1498)-N(3))-methyltransferase [Bacteroidales bacterium]
MNLFYCSDIPEMPALPLLARLDEEETRHALKVLRLQPGDAIRVTNGKGYHFIGTLTGITGKHVEFWLTEQIQVFDFSRPRIHIAVSPIKNPDRLEWLVEKATEAGVYRISFVVTQRTEKFRVNLERMQRLTVAALKQSMGGWLPLLTGPVEFNSLVKEASENEKYIAWCEGKNPLLWDALSGRHDTLILIGPEGDFTLQEAEKALCAGFTPVSLGTHRLRTETAGLVSIFAFQIISRNL